MQIRIEGRDLPGRVGPWRRQAGSPDVRVGVQRRGRNDDLLDLQAADATLAEWTIEATVAPGRDGEVDFRGPYIQGVPGQRFIYLSWVTVQPDGMLAMFRRAKLSLKEVAPEVMAAAERSGRLVARLRLTDGKGQPVCSSVKPPEVIWSAA